MSETDSSSTDEAYFRVIEETFIRLRGTPFLLSPADWQETQKWYRQGIPIRLVIDTLESVFRSRAESGKKGKVQSLRYLSSAVEDAWQAESDLKATGHSTVPEPIDTTLRLAKLAESLPSSFTLRQEFSERILRLNGSSEELERSLMELDQELLHSAFESMSGAQQDEIAQRVEVAIRQLDRNVDPSRLSEIRQRLRDQTIRNMTGLPLLSLFSSV